MMKRVIVTSVMPLGAQDFTPVRVATVVGDMTSIAEGLRAECADYRTLRYRCVGATVNGSMFVDRELHRFVKVDLLCPEDAPVVSFDVATIE